MCRPDGEILNAASRDGQRVLNEHPEINEEGHDDDYDDIVAELP